MRRSVKATTGVFAAALITATCTAASAPPSTHTRTAAENSGPAYFKMTDVSGHLAIVPKSTTGDPGCTTAENVGRQMASTLKADKAAIDRDQNNPSARRADLQRFVADQQSLQTQLTTAEAQATHQSVKAWISAMVSDLSTFNSGLLAVENGDMSHVSQMTTAAYKTQSDGNAVQASCRAVLPHR